MKTIAAVSVPLTLVALAVLLGSSPAGISCPVGKPCGATSGKVLQAKAETCCLAKNPAGQLAHALKALDAATKAVDTGDKKAANRALVQAKKLIADAQKTIAKCIRAKIANDKCPIMGGAIDPVKVTDKVLREFNGKTVAFCCPRCIPTWDKLSDADKQAKLNDVITQKKKHEKPKKAHHAENGHDEHKGHNH